MLKDAITVKDINIIFSGVNGKPDKKLKEDYLKRLFKKTSYSQTIETSESKINEQIIETWNYEISKNILREMFFESEKYKTNKNKKEQIDQAIDEWKELGLGELNWPFAAAAIDNYVHRLNRRDDISEQEKDKIISSDIIRFRRIKEINQLKNDYIEFIVVSYNDNIIPTFGNKRGTDFYIDGLPFDQKTSKSVGKDFIAKYGENYRKTAIDNPALLARSLYENQDSERFGAEPRFLVVYLDSDLTSDELEKLLKGIDFSKPLKFDFDYKDREGNINRYTTECYLILLHK